MAQKSHPFSYRLNTPVLLINVRLPTVHLYETPLAIN